MIMTEIFVAPSEIKKIAAYACLSGEAVKIAKIPAGATVTNCKNDEHGMRISYYAPGPAPTLTLSVAGRDSIDLTETVKVITKPGGE